MEYKEIRADYDDRHITVYQAYSPAIADAAVAAGRFVPPFEAGRMTWIKPSFRWMVYRCGWARKPGQERVLAVRITRDGFDRAVRDAVSSSAITTGKPDIRVQWDPERDLHHQPLDHRSIQIGLAGRASDAYVHEWTAGITDITPLVREIHGHVVAGDLDRARHLLPLERPYPL
ncbi:DUF4291 domain-containing protein [Actinosynnema sp. NPDC023587]|uniref:DUF4291 domain-containing protein n=1 Tax=Actinosynnema sp. NPDC023587 TaxID=3154695 RepID=UPI0033C5F549